MGGWAISTRSWTLIWEVGGVAAEAADCGPGDRVLDIAAGSGNAAIQAAQRGADVVASDLTPGALRPGPATRAEAAGVELEWVEADAEDLPFEDASFDVGAVDVRDHVRSASVRRRGRAGARGQARRADRARARGSRRASSARCSGRSPAFLNPPPPVEGPPVRWGTEDGCARAARRRVRHQLRVAHPHPALRRSRRRDDRLLHGPLRADGDGPPRAGARRAAGTSSWPPTASSPTAGTRPRTGRPLSRAPTSL